MKYEKVNQNSPKQQERKRGYTYVYRAEDNPDQAGKPRPFKYQPSREYFRAVKWMLMKEHKKNEKREVQKHGGEGILRLVEEGGDQV